MLAIDPPVRRRLVPEIVQTSAIDCGPAALKAALEGFGVTVSYGRLREACQTSVDGTSIDALEDVARQLGFDAEQIMVCRTSGLRLRRADRDDADRVDVAIEWRHRQPALGHQLANQRRGVGSRNR